MKANRVKHILKIRLDKECVVTLCGRVIHHHHCIFIINGSRKHDYLEWSDNVDCQNCLRKAFQEQPRK